MTYYHQLYPLTTRFECIFDHLEQHGLWCFPIVIVWDGIHWKKMPMVKWKDFQTRAATRQERKQWLAHCRHCSGGGIPTGPATELLVLDADGVDAIGWCELRGIPPTVIVHTPSGGVHYYFRYPTDLEVHNSVSSIATNVDIRGGGYVVAAGTRRSDGLTYYYEKGFGLGEVAIAAPPNWLVHWLTTASAPLAPCRDAHRSQRPAPRSMPLDLAQLVSGIPEGERDDRLFRLACWLRHRGYTAEQALAVLLDAAQRCQPPFPAQMAAAKVRSAWRYAP